MSDSDDSVYIVDDFVIPDTVRNTYKNEDTISDNEKSEENESDDDEGEILKEQCKVNGKSSDHSDVEPETPRTNSRFILYVTNLSSETTKSMLEDFFGDAGEIRAIRIPKVRLGCFAFVEMKDFDGFKVIAMLHLDTSRVINFHLILERFEVQQQRN